MLHYDLFKTVLFYGSKLAMSSQYLIGQGLEGGGI